jgi:chemotaxis protein MotB
MAFNPQNLTPHKQEEESEDWMTTFADMMTLLLAFFVLLASISKVDVVLFEQVKAGMAEGIGNRKVETPVENLKDEVSEVIKSLKVEDTVGIGTDSQGVTLEFAAGSFFAPGSAQFNQDAEPILSKIAATIGADRYTGFQIEVQGHTDDTPISTPQFPSNWELSAARASSVIRYFLEVGIAPARMKAVGYADTSPKVPNRGPTGEPLPINQEINRRVIVRIFPR